ncbi:c-type cytochrome domain-containing protein [Euzebyella saccharophila]|uniref:C-type cytochrome domain-containing protein n=1 Tax=Euzebyella saccharophila TaxID=679664 RepID=A0ABV8JQ56_9FLAO|nr:c-type cytochrome domain-containing protein [Euzebyella saccharophila]
MLKHFTIFICSLLALTSCTFEMPEEVEVAYNDLPEDIDFNFHIKPILSDRCFSCHGPDPGTRHADLRLDVEENAFGSLSSGNRAFVAGKPTKSESVARILSDDPETLMPPPESNLSLSAREKAMIVKWIEQGAEWKPHWAFAKPEKPTPPKLNNVDLVKNEIDYFVQDQLIQRGFEPSPETGKERLLRRVTMDLTSLPLPLRNLTIF